MIKLLILLFVFLNFSIHAQENDEEISINEERNIAINDLIEKIKINKGIYLDQDQKRLTMFLNRVEERSLLLNDAKSKLTNEKNRNKKLEAAFEENEKILTELEDKLQIKIGVLGELFGVARQYAGELAAANENSVIFYEYPDRQKKLKDLAIIKVHKLNELEDLWLSYFDEISAGGDIKILNTNITNSNGESFKADVTRYGLFNIVYKDKYLKPISSLNAFQMLPRQPEKQYTKSLKKHANAKDHTIVAVDPTRGFLLSLYLDKPSWFERIAQGKLVGFIIIFIGLIGLIFSCYKIFILRDLSNFIIESNKTFDQEMHLAIADSTSINSKENLIDEFIINYSKKIEWGNNWIKFIAAVAPLLGLLGTVIGMIETFQAITLFGTGDPKQMAGGISQALITTMLGLIVAAPLLGFYTYLSEKSSSLIQIIEEKASYILGKS